MASSIAATSQAASQLAAPSRLATVRPLARTAAALQTRRHPALQHQQQQRRVVATATLTDLVTLAAVEIDWSDPDVQIGALGAVLGLGLGIGVPVFYTIRTERDEERLEELRELNRATKAETGEYLTEEEIAAIRPPRWTDRREFVDND